MRPRRTISGTEKTPADAQPILDGVAPVTMRDRLAFKAAAPLEPRAVQKRCDHGLFDTTSRRQIDLIDELRRLNRSHARPPTDKKGE